MALSPMMQQYLETKEEYKDTVKDIGKISKKGLFLLTVNNKALEIKKLEKV